MKSAVKSGDKNNAMTKTLEKYNVKLTDANGNLKKGIELSLALADGLKKAQEEGKGAEFIAAVGGKFWSGDFITYLEDLRDNIETAKKIVKNGLSDPTLAHKVQGDINTMEKQAAELKASFASAFIPVANEIIPRITERMGELTKFIADNKDEIKAVGAALGTVFNTIEKVAEIPFIALQKTYTALKDLYSLANEDHTIKLYLYDSEVKNAEDLLKKELQRTFSFTERAAIEANPVLYQQTLAHYEPMFKALEEARQKAEKAAKAIKDGIDKQNFLSLHISLVREFRRINPKLSDIPRNFLCKDIKNQSENQI